MKLYTVVVYDLGLCMKEDSSSRKNIMGGNSREIIMCVGQSILCDLTYSSSFMVFWPVNCIVQDIHIN